MKINGKQIKLDDMTNQSINFAYGFGGYAAGRIVGKAIDNYLVKNAVSGLGADPDSMGMKMIKPVSTLTLSAILNLSAKDKAIKTASMGMGIAGVEQAVNVVAKKDLISGLGYEDTDSNMPMIPLNLPNLSENYPAEIENNNIISGDIDDEFDDYDELEYS